MEKKYEKLYEKIKLLRGKETMNQITQIIKEAYPDAVVALMGGTFYNVYGKDAVIVSELMEYKLKEWGVYANAGFPEKSADKVASVLESKEIDYIFIDKSLQYDIVLENSFSNLNRYEKEYERCFRLAKRRKIIKKINIELLDGIRREGIDNILKKMESLIYEW